MSKDIVTRLFGEEPFDQKPVGIFPDPLKELQIYSDVITLFKDAHNKGSDTVSETYENLRHAGYSPRFLGYASTQALVEILRS